MDPNNVVFDPSNMYSKDLSTRTLIISLVVSQAPKGAVSAVVCRWIPPSRKPSGVADGIPREATDGTPVGATEEFIALLTMKMPLGLV